MHKIFFGTDSHSQGSGQRRHVFEPLLSEYFRIRLQRLLNNEFKAHDGPLRRSVRQTRLSLSTGLISTDKQLYDKTAPVKQVGRLSLRVVALKAS